MAPLTNPREKAAWTAVALLLALGLALGVSRQVRVATRAPVEEQAPRLVLLHLRASRGEITLLRGGAAGDALAAAGFPPGTPVPDLGPRTELLGVAVLRLERGKVALAHYRDGPARFTLATLPAALDPIPADAVTVIRRGASLRFARRDGLSLAFWTWSPWVSVLVAEAPDAQRDRWLDLALAPHR